jgi:geranylgeranyl pyrophosphate synthase
MRFDPIRQRLIALPEVAAWPEMLRLVERAVHVESLSVWEYPVLAARAVGGNAEAALPGAAAIFCSLAAIHLVDDLLDEDPRGDYRRLGAGYAANLALAFQAAAHRVLEQAAPSAEVLAAAQASLARMALATAYGQSLDAHEVAGEEDYWRVMGAKTPPLFASALAVGGLLGGASVSLGRELEELGALIGEFIQVSDDLADSLKTPAGADWRRPRNSLPLLYALTADHPERDEFARLAREVEDPAALLAAQRILLRSGAVSFCLYQLIERGRRARGRLASIPIADPAPLARLLDLQRRPVYKLLEFLGVEEPLELPAEPRWMQSVPSP